MEKTARRQEPIGFYKIDMDREQSVARDAIGKYAFSLYPSNTPLPVAIFNSFFFIESNSSLCHSFTFRYAPWSCSQSMQ